MRRAVVILCRGGVNKPKYRIAEDGVAGCPSRPPTSSSMSPYCGDCGLAYKPFSFPNSVWEMRLWAKLCFAWEGCPRVGAVRRPQTPPPRQRSCPPMCVPKRSLGTRRGVWERGGGTGGVVQVTVSSVTRWQVRLTAPRSGGWKMALDSPRPRSRIVKRCKPLAYSI